MQVAYLLCLQEELVVAAVVVVVALAMVRMGHC